MSLADDIIATARTALGKPYVFGAEGPHAFDCSGLVQWAYGKHGIRLPRIAEDQARAGKRVELRDIRPGDLIFSTWDASPDVDHVAIYIGDGQYIHAPKPGDVVKIGRITESYKRHITNVQRVIPDSGGSGRITIPVPGVGGVVTGGVVGALDTIAGGVRTIADQAVSVGNLAATVAKLALPTTQVRIVCGVLGVLLLGSGVYVMAREVT